MEGPAYALPPAPPLPSERVLPSAPFDHVGLDYIGPLYVKSTGTGGNSDKVWICLFTCFVTRAIHLELLSDQSTHQFLNCLRRFIARRGKPSLLYSDNASQLKLASSVLDSSWEDAIKQQEVLEYVSSQGIQWKFIVALAPWQGGVYERLVGMVRNHYARLLVVNA